MDKKFIKILLAAKVNERYSSNPVNLKRRKTIVEYDFK